MRHNHKYSGLPSVLILAQITIFIVYLYANVVNVGEAGTALPLLAAYVGFSGLIFLLLFLQKNLFFRLHFFVFIVFIAWIALKVIFDLGDLEYLKQVTIATTSGILLFYLTGAFFGISYVRMQEEPRKTTSDKFIITAIFALSIYLLINLLSRIRTDVFLIADLDGSYQRPGSFISISFIIVSVIFVSLLSNWNLMHKKKSKSLFWFLVYSVITIFVLINSQLFGSNSATAVVIGLYSLTVVTILLIRNRRLQRLHADGSLAWPLSSEMIRSLFKYCIVSVIWLFALLFFLVYGTNFDVSSTRFAGFHSGVGTGSGSIASLTSRFDILIQTGVDQISYAPFLGNMNVAFHVTGDAGKTLHSFFLFIFANLGLLGLLIIATFFYLIFRQLYNQAKLKSRPEGSFIYFLTTFYFILILLFLMLFANLSVGMTWPVIWFAVGFVSQPFGFRSKI